MVCNTESGSITSELLVLFLEQMDRLELFPRTEGGPKPFLLLDRHGSRLELPFLQYVNDPAHQWIVCIGVPYGTSYWQVGDSSEQNGSYKMALTKCKKELVLKKQRACMKNARIETYEIVIVVNAAWNKSFARISFNKQAIAARGWYPLTRNLLDHPEIAATQEQSTEMNQTDSSTSAISSEQQSVAASLNYSNGLANTVIADILQNVDREAVREQIRANQQEGQQAANTLAEAKKLSAGVVFKSGRAYLGPEVLQAAIERKNKREEKEKEISERLKAEQTKRKQAYEKALEEVCNLTPSRWSVAQLKALVNYKKRKTDKWAQPKTRAQLLEKWEEIKHRRTSPPGSPARGNINNSEELPISPTRDEVDKNEE
jgi:hypothetical protein